MIRPAKPSDAAQILDIYAPIIRHTAITFECDIPEVEEFEERIRKTTEFYPYLVWEKHRKILGYTYATRFRSRKAYDWVCESAIYVSENARGKGIGQKLYLKLFECLRVQGLISVIAVVRPHAQTVDFHEALGFQKVGVIPYGGYKHNEWHDAGFWQLILFDPVPAKPEPVRSFPKYC